MACKSFKLTVEVPFLLTYFSFMLVSSIAVNLNMYKTCYNLLGYPEVNCSRLGRYTDEDTLALEKIVQPTASYVTVITQIVPSSIPVLISLVIGSWSDKYGRKPVLVYVLICILLGFLMSAIMLAFNELDPFTLMIASLPAVACGGPHAFFSVTLAYLNDLATPETRGMRMAVYEIIVIFSLGFGTLLSPILLYATNYAIMYGIGAVLIGIATLYTYFFLPESLKNRSTEKATCSNVFTCQNITGLFIVAFKKRPFNKRTIILLLIGLMLVFNFITSGENNIKFLYLRTVFSWTLIERNIFVSWSSVVDIIATMIFTYVLHKRLKIKETILICMGLHSFIGVALLYALAQNQWYIYGSAAVGILGGLVITMLRTKLGQSIDPSEMGRIFSLITVLNSFLSLGSNFLYSFIYNTTLDTRPETFNYVSIGLYGFCLVILITVVIIEYRQPAEAKQGPPKVESKSQQDDNTQQEETQEVECKESHKNNRN